MADARTKNRTEQNSVIESPLNFGTRGTSAKRIAANLLLGAWEPGRNKMCEAVAVAPGLAMAWACSAGMACVARGGSACVRGRHWDYWTTGQRSSTT
jgi:hypothetical protein